MSQDKLKIDQGCTLCGYCQLACPKQAISIKGKVEIDSELCNTCQRCVYVCPVEAITVVGAATNKSFNVSPTVAGKPARFDAVVIGAGLGGLLAAAFLCKQGKKVAVLEKLEFLGGRFSSFDYGGYQVSTGAIHMVPHGFSGPLGCSLRALNLPTDFTQRDVLASFHFEGRHFIAQRPSDVFTMLSLRDRLDLAKILVRLKMEKRLPGDISFAEWLNTQTGSPVLLSLSNKFINFSVSAQAGDVPYNEIRHLFKNTRDFGLPQVPKGGCKAIIDNLEASINANGGSVLKAETAEQILVEGTKISGVKSTNRKSHESRVLSCRCVVSDIGVERTANILGRSAFASNTESSGETKVARGLELHFASDVSLIPHKGIMFCLDSKTICGIVQPSNADPMLAPENKHLIVTYQVSQTNNLASELAMAWDDLDMIFGASFRKHCHLLNIGFFNNGWPVNKAVQGTDYRLISPLPGLYLVGDDCKPEGYIMAEGVARSVELALAKMASDISAEKEAP